MAAALHLLEAGDATPALDVIAAQVAAGDHVTVILLPGAPAPALPADVALRRVPDDLAWEALVDLIFAADHVVAW
jgi:hypothetical protein